MSNQNPRARRRIAGERRPARPEESAAAPEAPTDESAAQPVDLGKEPALEAPAPAEPRPEPAEHAEHAEAEDAEQPTAAVGGPSWTLVSAVGLLAALLLVVVAVLGLAVWKIGDVRRADQVDEATRTAPAVAERASAAILSYDHSTLDADEKAAERYMTPAYAKKYADTFKLVKANAPTLKAKVVAEVKASGVTHADPDRATVLLYVDQTTTSTANGGEPQLALNRVQLSMVRQGGTWLVDDITSY